MSTLRVSTIQDTAGSNSSTPAQVASGRAKAWVKFVGSGTVSIFSSYNVTSVTDNGTGNYTVNMTSAMANASYAVTCGCTRVEGTGTTANSWNLLANPNNPTTTSFTMFSYYSDSSSAALLDAGAVHAAVFA